MFSVATEDISSVATEDIGVWEASGRHLKASPGIRGIWRHLEASGRHLDDKSSATLTPNANLLRKCKFCDVFLKVRAPGTAIYDNLAKSLGRDGSSDNHRPTTKTARTPTADSCLGKN